MSKVITYTSFAVASLLVILAFLTAKTYSQLAIAVVLFPALAYFALLIFPRKAHTLTIQISASKPEPKPQDLKKEKVEVVDVDKRTFLKLVGAVGISFFLFSLLGDKLKSMLFGSSLAPAPNANPDATRNIGSSSYPTAGYSVSEIDEGETSYYGFTSTGGAWLIMKEDSVTNSFRYAKGALGFPANWVNRTSLKYDYYYNLS